VQVKPEQAASQQAVTVLPVMEAEPDLSILLAPQATSEEEAVLPLHLPVISWSQQAACALPTIVV
jgi:hypothetical protein